MIYCSEVSLLFLKTPKTASSSIELWLAEQYFGIPVMTEGQHPDIPPRINSNGVMTKISMNRITKSEIKPHLSLDGAVRLLGDETMEKTHIATSVRNPFDQVLSFFFWNVSQNNPVLYRTLASAGKGTLSKHFNRFVRKLKGSFLSQRRYLISDSGRYKTEHIFRYESLETDFRAFAESFLGNQSFHSLPRLKTGLRPQAVEYRDLYDSRSRRKIDSLMAWELENLGYDY